MHLRGYEHARRVSDLRRQIMGMAMQDYGLGLRVGLKDLPTLRIHRQILTELKTFLFYHSTFLTGGTHASRARLRDVPFLALCSSSFRKTTSAKATATGAWDWKDPEAEDQAPGPHPISAPIQVPPSPPHEPHVCPPKDLTSHGREKLGREARKSSCRTRRTRRMR